MKFMVRIVKSGYLDLVGSARQSIADPFLPNKLRENKPDQVRPCIKCNICIAGDLSAVGVQCTQNPSFGEEWRRGWHPEDIPPRQSESKILVIGGGPAGLECTRALGQRGYDVLLCEARMPKSMAVWAASAASPSATRETSNEVPPMRNSTSPHAVREIEPGFKLSGANVWMSAERMIPHYFLRVLTCIFLRPRCKR